VHAMLFASSGFFVEELVSSSVCHGPGPWLVPGYIQKLLFVRFRTRTAASLSGKDRFQAAGKFHGIESLSSDGILECRTFFVSDRANDGRNGSMTCSFHEFYRGPQRLEIIRSHDRSVGEAELRRGVIVAWPNGGVLHCRDMEIRRGPKPFGV